MIMIIEKNDNRNDDIDKKYISRVALPFSGFL